VRLVFGEHVVDVDRRELYWGAERVALEPQVFDLLVYLVQNHNRVVSRDDLLDAVWDGRIVSESTVTSRISAVRKAIGDSGAAQQLIRTVPRKGIRFVGVVREEQKTAGPVDAQPMAVRNLQSLPAVPSAETKSPPRLSIVVLPFVNLSRDPEQEYFADGVTEDLTTELSRLDNMFVISRNTAFTYRNRPIDTKQIGRELAVRYVLEGSVRRSGRQLRLNTQLIDAATDAHLWAERFDRDTGDLFAVQNEITNQIANALGIELIAAEAARPTKNPDALDYGLRARAALLKPRTRDTYEAAIDLFEQALALDPQSVEIQSRLAVVLVTRVLEVMSDSAKADLARAEALVDQALQAAPRYAYAHFAKGHLLRAQNRWEQAIAECQAALEANHNLVHAFTDLAWCKLYTGSIDEVIPLVKQAIRLSPRDPFIGGCYALIGTVHLLQSCADEAIAWLEKARTARPAAPVVRSRLASAYALRGEIERANAELTEARKLNGGDVYQALPA
jgi:TolB-like protein/Flp pilus assembly protein TadD